MLWLAVALAGAMLLFVPGLFEQFETPKIELVRVCGLGALALAGGRASRPRRWHPLDRAVAVWLAVEVAATALSRSPRLSLLGESRQHEGLLTSLALVGLYAAAREATRRRLGATLLLVVAGASLAGGYALIQVFGADPIAWRREAVYAGGYVRPFATLGHPNLLGVVSAAAATIALGLALAPRAASPRWLPGGAAALLAAVTVLTLSRAAWLAIAAGAVAATALALAERGRVRLSRRAFVTSAATIAVMVGLLGLAARWSPLGQRLEEFRAGGGVSGSSRIEIWRSAVAAWRARPLVGQGPDLFELTFPRFQTAAYWRYEWSGLPVHAHSIYLHTLATRGLLGLGVGLLWAGALLAAAASLWRRRARIPNPGLLPAGLGALVALAVAGVFGALGINGALLVVLISAALATADEAARADDVAAAHPASPVVTARDRARPGRRSGGRPAKTAGPERSTPGHPRGSGRGRTAARLAAAVVALASGAWGWTEMRASRAASAARFFMTGDPPRAVQASAAAVGLTPHDDRSWRLRAETLLWLSTGVPEPARPLAAAEDAARRAVALAPERAENHRILARALAARAGPGDMAAAAAAEAEYRESLALAPMDGMILMDYADWTSVAGRPETALSVSRRGVALYPDMGEMLALLARALWAAGERDSARLVLERALRSRWYLPEERRAAERQLAELRRLPATRSDR
jgi:O-antigen ligase